jgi:hypothetical protein
MANEEKHEPVFEEQIAQIIAELDFIYEHGTNATIAWVEDLIDVLYAHIADGRSLPHDFFISMHTQLNALRAEEDVKKNWVPTPSVQSVGFFFWLRWEVSWRFDKFEGAGAVKVLIPKSDMDQARSILKISQDR